MAEQSERHPEDETATLHFARWVVQNRLVVAFGLILATLFFLYPTVNAVSSSLGYELPGPLVRIDASARSQWPDHPFIHAQDEFGKTFGSSSLVAIAVVVNEGTIFTPETLEKLSRITRRLDGEGYDSRSAERDAYREEIEKRLPKDAAVDTAELIKILDRKFPPYPVNHDRVQSLTHSSTRVVTVEPDGAISSEVLITAIPKSQRKADIIREKVRQNPPFIFGRLVSLDEKGALLSANFITDRLSGREVYKAVFDHVQKIKNGWKCTAVEIENGTACTLGEWIWEPEEDEEHRIFISGDPIGTAWILTHAFEIVRYVLLTIVLTFALLLAYFRRIHGVLIPFIAALTTSIWGLGFSGWMGITFDPLVLVIPMIITARAVSHSVQMAERFFEEFEVLMPRFRNDPEQAKLAAATAAMAKLFVPATLGIVTDGLGLLVILMTSIPQMRDLAVFGAFWVFSILFTVELLHPILICFMAPPRIAEHYVPSFMTRLLRGIGGFVTGPTTKFLVAGLAIGLLASSSWIVFTQSKIGEARPGTPLLAEDHPFNVATAAISGRFGGVDSFVIYADGHREEATADPAVIQKMEEFERWMTAHTNLRVAVSLVPIIRAYWQQNHYGDPKWNFIPNDSGTVRNVLFQLRQNGSPGFLRPYATHDDSQASLGFFYPDHKGDTVQLAISAAREFIRQNPIGELELRLESDRAAPDAGVFGPQRMADRIYYLFGPMLPRRPHTLHLSSRDPSGSYSSVELPRLTRRSQAPAWLEEFAEGARRDYQRELQSMGEGGYFAWPEELEDWDASDVDAVYENEELGIRAVAMKTRNLIVHDLNAVDSLPRYQPTQSWSRGVQFVMAGGVMGVLAAVNEEVERGHIANISLILLVVFILQIVTYRSVWIGGIIVVQLATATMLSLAYMAIQGVGLNISTLPVQSVGVGIGVDYAIYIVDRVRQEIATGQAGLDEALRRTIQTTGMAVSFTATTLVAGIATWTASNLRFQSEMAWLLAILMVINMLGSITVVPALLSIFGPSLSSGGVERVPGSEMRSLPRPSR
ncbi:MAG: MMPL family transporter [bacterium]|nr:MMPL family transporter [bacterium]